MKILVIQTAFIGDVILATSLLEELHRLFPVSQLDICVRKGNESLFDQHPFIHEVLTWNKKEKKYLHLFRLSRKIRNSEYDLLINLQRFGASGFLTWRSKAKQRIGFDKNPFSFSFTKKVTHEIGNGLHETERNLKLIADFGAKAFVRPKLYPQAVHEDKTKSWKSSKYICAAPSSVWFTKQLPEKKWVELFNKIPADTVIYLLGAKNDHDLCEAIRGATTHQHTVNLSGRLSFLESASLMRDATMNYVNDSAPLHIASSVNAPVTAFFCSTIPEFGFGPLSDDSSIIQSVTKPDCKPCGLHGYAKCPKGHFKCGLEIEV